MCGKCNQWRPRSPRPWTRRPCRSARLVVPRTDGAEPNLFGAFRSQINNLCPNGRMGKLGFGAPNKCLICNVEPVSESYDTDMNLIWEKFGKLV